MRHLLWVCVATIVWAVLTPPAAAHKTALARIEITVVGDRADISLIAPALDFEFALRRRIIPGETYSDMEPVPRELVAAIEAYVAPRIRLALAQSEACAAVAGSFGLVPQGTLIGVHSAFGCPRKIGSFALSYDVFFDEDADHRAIVLAAGPFGPQMEAVLDRTARSVTFSFEQAGQATGGISFARLLVLGVEHILEGIDHVFFLIVLLLGLPRVGQALAVVTAFTLAHSVTLGLAWFGIITLPSGPVEIVIALSIAYVAAENIFRRDVRHRWLLAGAFGLVHGLGFYGALSELGLEGANAAKVLLGFNIGVELGQIIILAIAAPALWWVRQQGWKEVVVRSASAVFMAVALWWAFERSFA